MTQKLLKNNMIIWFERICRNMKSRYFKGKNKKYTNKSSCHKCGSFDYFLKECSQWE